MNKAFLYLCFAILATALNILTQELSLFFYHGRFALYVAVIMGTGAGLVAKYLLDKRFIFNHRTDSTKANVAAFSKYSFTGLFTTVIFWSFELAFEFLIGGKVARYTGAVIGLSIGYAIKFQLDRALVFTSNPAGRKD